MDAGRLAYRVAVTVQWIVFLVWGLAIWGDWDGVQFLWLAFGVAMFAAQFLKHKVMKTSGPPGKDARQP